MNQTSNLTPQIFNYLNTPTYKTLPYTGFSTIFTNQFLTDCGSATNCYLRAQGCVAPYTGHVTMDPVTFAITAQQDYDPGYQEYLCVVCENSASGTTGTLGDNWYVEQRMNCNIAM